MWSVLVRSCIAGAWLLGGAAVVAQQAPAPARSGRGDEAQALVDAVVLVHSRAFADARSIETLGRERAGSGIVIDASGLALTIGYLVIEAETITLTTAAGRTVPAALAAYDHATGFALLKPLVPLPVQPVVLGESGALREQDVVMTLPFGGREAARLARVVSRRLFTGSWEYLLEEAIFTAPPTAQWAGAALIDRNGRLVGVGSLMVRDASGGGDVMPGNLFVPIDLLKPIFEDLVAKGKRGGPARPWLGLATEAVQGRLLVTRVSPEGPADLAGIAAGDVVLGVGGAAVASQAELYRRLWGLGAAGVDVSLRVMRAGAVREVTVTSIERTAYFRDPVRQ
jgi:S1-C subfamily serine protease